MSSYPYRCPKCYTRNRMHDFDCEWAHKDVREFERYYVDILSVLTAKNGDRVAFDLDPGITLQELVEAVVELPAYADARADADDLRDLESVASEDLAMDETDPGSTKWTTFHWACFKDLKQRGLVIDTEDGIRTARPEERTEYVVPQFEPLKTIYECGPASSHKDYAVYTMVSWCTLKEMDWTQTRNFLREWLTDTNGWDRNSWGESSMAELINGKKHVWRAELGWGEYPELAKQSIDDEGLPHVVTAADRRNRTPDDYDTR